jgi:hypothetical protein
MASFARLRGSGFAVAAVLAMGALPFSAVAASTTPHTFGATSYSFVNQAHRICLDAATQTDNANGGKVQLWSCNGGADEQWYFKSVGSGWGELVNRAHGLCLDASAQADGNNGDVVQVWKCLGDTNQLWKNTHFNQPWAILGGTLENQAAVDIQTGTLCLDAAAQSDGSNGDKVQLWNCLDDTNQIWDSTTSAVNLDASKCLDAAAQTDGSNGGKVQIWSCIGDLNQQWVFEPMDGEYELVNMAHRLCLDAAAQTDGTNGGKVQLWKCEGNADQLWAHGNNFTLRNHSHGLCLDAAAQTDTKNGGKVQLYVCGVSGESNQAWSWPGSEIG